MGKKSRENKQRRIEMAKSPISHAPVYSKKGFSNGKKILISVTLIAVIVISVSAALSFQSLQPGLQTQAGYPQNVSPVTYSSAVLSSEANKISAPISFINSSKLVFIDLKLKSPLQTLQYQDRTIPLAYYRNGEYLPLIIISTPQGNTVSGIRTCEPCGSFSFHIVKGANLKCDSCGTEWTLENFAPVSGGCGSYPPPKLPTNLYQQNIEIDLSTLQLQYA